ncbi:helix-turn-helix domain-containing protein [Brevundimonas sp. 2R-24]|uniref:Helix-turn-helix domain-containing protein n=1 Tax=Peiella sedimenti TaxID=3061083 RepID=A0ABT8SQS4_9CAUL|nr:helix-turn-helix domain-containing protein [Caulobacteraceae bacterium XZ-24]
MTAHELARIGLEAGVAGQMLVLAAYLLGSQGRTPTRVLTAALALALVGSASLNAMAAAGVLVGWRGMTVALEGGMALLIVALTVLSVWPSVSLLRAGAACVLGAALVAVTAGPATDPLLMGLGAVGGLGALGVLTWNRFRARTAPPLLWALPMWWLLVVGGRATLSAGVARGDLNSYRDGAAYPLLLAATFALSSWMLFLALTRRPPFDTPPRPKYARSYLSAADVRDLRARIDAQLASDVWRDPDLDLDGFAQRIGATPREASQVINAQFGCNFAALIARRRAEAAARLLRERPDLTITEVMFEAGYGSKSAFHRAFRDRWGRSPGDYRREA